METKWEEVCHRSAEHLALRWGPRTFAGIMLITFLEEDHLILRHFLNTVCFVLGWGLGLAHKHAHLCHIVAVVTHLFPELELLVNHKPEEKNFCARIGKTM